MKKIYENKKIIILISCIIILIVFLLSFINKEEKNKEEISLNTITKTIETTKKEEKAISYVDIKGYVNNPNVYEIMDNYTIQDIINLAGGLKKKAYTNNINLSKKVKDEMVIYIFSENEINKIKELSSCECTPTYKYIECEEIKTTIPTTTITTNIIETTTTTHPKTTIPITTSTIEPITETTTIKTTSTTTTTSIAELKININTCTIEELIKLKGLGEIKAKKIIEYREINGLFKVIEDILKVDGIGESTLEKIKDFIEV